MDAGAVWACSPGVAMTRSVCTNTGKTAVPVGLARSSVGRAVSPTVAAVVNLGPA